MKQLKKIISALLAICLLISLAPAAFAGGEAEPRNQSMETIAYYEPSVNDYVPFYENEAEAEQAGASQFALYDEDGHGYVYLSEETLFSISADSPYEQRFLFEGKEHSWTVTEWPGEESYSLGGHTFSLAIGDPVLYSIQNLTSVNSTQTVYLNNLLYDELAQIKVQDLLKYWPTGADKPTKPETGAVAWKERWTRDDEYTVVEDGINGSIDLTKVYSNSYSSINLELIIGENSNTLSTDPRAVRYFVEVQIGLLRPEDILMFAAAVEKQPEKTREDLPIIDQSFYADVFIDNNSGLSGDQFRLCVKREQYKDNDPAWLKLSLKTEPRNDIVLSAVYKGYYDSLDEIADENPELVTDQITSDVLADGGLYFSGEDNMALTAVLSTNGVKLAVPFYVKIEPSTDALDFSGLYEDSSTDASLQRLPVTLSFIKTPDGIMKYTLVLPKGKKADASYFLLLNYYDYEQDSSSLGSHGAKLIKSVYLGKHANEESATQSKAVSVSIDELFGKGYKAQYHEGVLFTVFVKNSKEPHYISITTEEASVRRREMSISLYPAEEDGSAIDSDTRPLSTTSHPTISFVLSLEKNQKASDSYQISMNLYDFYNDSGPTSEITPPEKIESIKLHSSGAEIKDQLLNGQRYMVQNFSAPLEIDVTIDGKTFPVRISVKESSVYNREMSISLYPAEGGDNVIDSDSSLLSTTSTTACSLLLLEKQKASDSYQISMKLSDYYTNGPSEDTPSEKIESIRLHASGTEIKEQILNGKRYTVQSFSTPLELDVTIDGKTFPVQISVEEIKATPPRPLFQDTYFHIEGANANANDPDSAYTNSAVMSFGDDGYYYNGYQTLFLLDGNRSSAYSFAKDTTIYPVFDPGERVTIYVNDEGTNKVGEPINQSAGRVESGRHPVQLDGAVTTRQYSAGAENGNYLKNYWVSFVTKSAEKNELFVNGVTNAIEAHKIDHDQNESTPKIAQRIVVMDQAHGNYHDIFLANLGSEKMTGLDVRLMGQDGTGTALGVQLDPYWNLKGSSLEAFTATEPTEFDGVLSDNATKIRLIPTDDKSPVSGLLEISYYDADDGAVHSVQMALTGYSDNFDFTTDELRDGVLYVPYEQVVQNSSMMAANAVEYQVTGLPNDLRLQSNGVIYGMPKESVINRKVTVSATLKLNADLPDGKSKTISKEYSLTIKDNTNENVWLKTDFDGYQLTTAIPNGDGTWANIINLGGPVGSTATIGDNSWSNSTMSMVSQGMHSGNVPAGEEGEHIIFRDLYLDGKKLTRGVDYTDQAGSTVLTIQTQTLDVSEGRHTLAMEFYQKDPGDSTLKTTNQNYNIPFKAGPDDSDDSSNDSAWDGDSSDDSSGGSSSSGKPLNNGKPSKGSSEEYSIILEQSEHGSIKTDRTQAAKGGSVIITANPETNYTLSEAIVTDGNGNKLPVTSLGNNQYSFTMTAGNVTVTAVFAPIVDVADFVDVSKDDWFYPYVQWAYDRAYMVGVASNQFAPDSPVNQAIIVQVLANIADADLTGLERFSYDSIPEGKWYTNAAIWARQAGLLADDSGSTPEVVEMV